MFELKCNKCNNIFKSKTGLTYHERRCDGSGIPKSKRNRKSQFIKCDICGFFLKKGFFKKHHDTCKGKGPRRKHDKITSKELSDHISKGIKLRYKNDPEYVKKISYAQKNYRKLSRELTPEKEIERNRKISISLKGNPNVGGYREGSGRGIKSTYISSIAGTVKLDSNFEVEFAKELDRLKINWKRNTTRFYFIWNGIKTYYVPDFYLIDKDLYIETKGYWYKDKKERILKAVKVSGINLQIVMQTDWILNKKIFL
jgi:hypothetical protein